MLVTVKLSKSFKNMTEQERRMVVEFFWRQLPRQINEYDAHTFTMDGPTSERANG